MAMVELENTTVQQTDAINDADPTDIGDTPEVIIEKTSKEIDEFSKVYLDFKKENYK